MPRGVYERRGGLRAASSISATQKESGPVTQVAPTEAPAVKPVKMVLKRHYVPHKLISIVGYERPARFVKNAAGETKEVEPAKFIEGEAFPALFPGVGYDNKIWAKTVIEVPEDEARDMRQKGIAEAYI